MIHQLLALFCTSADGDDDGDDDSVRKSLDFGVMGRSFPSLMGIKRKIILYVSTGAFLVGTHTGTYSTSPSSLIARFTAR